MSTILSSCASSLAVSGSVNAFKSCGQPSFRATRLLIALAAGLWFGLVGTGCTVKKVSGYTYPSELPGGEVAGWIREGGDLAVLSQPLGEMPDYALVCEVAGYTEQGVPVLLNWSSIRITLTLSDLKTRTAIWTVTEKGGTAEGALLPGSGLLLTLMSTKDERLREGVYSVVNRALKSLPAVPGYRKL